MRKAPAPGKHPFEGVIIAAVTPRRKHETSIDLGATLELIDFLGRTGANAIALLGSTGEFLHFAIDDRRHMTDFAAKRSRLPLLVNVSHSTLDGSVELAREAAGSGAEGVLLMPPYYFSYSQDAIRRFFLDFANETGDALPIFLYNIPQFTNEISIETALDLLDTGRFAGIKDSSGSWEYFTALNEQCSRRPFTLLAGNDRIYTRARMAGAHGVVSGVACALPELLIALEEAIAANETDRIAALDARLQEFIDHIEGFPVPSGIKEAVRERKIKTGVNSIEPGENEQARTSGFVSWFRSWLPAVLQECQTRSKVGRSGGH